MILTYSDKLKLFIFKCRWARRGIAIRAGFERNHAGDYWYTDDPITALNLRQYATDSLEELFLKYDKYLQKQIKVSSATKLDESFHIPKKVKEYDYFPYQKAGVKYLWEHKKALLADDQGLGKSIQIAGLINLINTRQDFETIIIMCPNTLKGNWKREIERWCDLKGKSIAISSGSEIVEGNIMIINFEAFRNTLNKNDKRYKDPVKHWNSSHQLLEVVKKRKKIDLFVVDESHNLKSLKANTTKNVFRLKKYCDRAVWCSGTPILSKPEEMWTTIKFLGFEKEFEGRKDNFMMKYCGAKYDRRLRRVVVDQSLITPNITKELQLRLRNNFMIRRLKKDVLKELPNKIRTIVPVPINLKRLEEFGEFMDEEMNIDKINTNPSESILKGMSPSNIATMSEIKKITGMEKLKPVTEFVKELISTDNKVILFGHHKEVLAFYAMQFKGKYAMITGDTPAKDRQGEVDKFQNDPNCRLFIGNFKAAGVGITLTASSHVVFAELDWVPAMMIQAEDRAHRIGQDMMVNVYYMVAESTIDPYIATTLIKKMEYFEKAMNKEHL